MQHIDIGILEHYSGVKAHTIRAWESRFKVLHPDRVTGNRRIYSEEDASILLQLALLTRHGYPISRLIYLTRWQLEEKITQLDVNVAGADIALYHLLASYIRGDFTSFEKTLTDFLEKRGHPTILTELVRPFMKRTGIIAYNDSQNRTHFAVTTLRKIILHSTQNVCPKAKFNFTVLLFLPKDQHYDLILLYISYLLQYEGYRVLYLGTNIAPNNLSEAVRQYEPEVIVTYLSSESRSTYRQLNEYYQPTNSRCKMFIATADVNLQEKYGTIIDFQKVVDAVNESFCSGAS